MSTLEVRLISLSLRLMLAQPAFFTQARAALIPERSIIGKSKRQPKLPGDHQPMREIVGQR